jgi:hypothetical protein
MKNHYLINKNKKIFNNCHKVYEIFEYFKLYIYNLKYSNISYNNFLYYEKLLFLKKFSILKDFFNKNLKLSFLLKFIKYKLLKVLPLSFIKLSGKTFNNLYFINFNKKDNFKFLLKKSFNIENFFKNKSFSYHLLFKKKYIRKRKEFLPCYFKKINKFISYSYNLSYKRYIDVIKRKLTYKFLFKKQYKRKRFKSYFNWRVNKYRKKKYIKYNYKIYSKRLRCAVFKRKIYRFNSYKNKYIHIINNNYNKKKLKLILKLNLKLTNYFNQLILILLYFNNFNKLLKYNNIKIKSNFDIINIKNFNIFNLNISLNSDPIFEKKKNKIFKYLNFFLKQFLQTYINAKNFGLAIKRSFRFKRYKIKNLNRVFYFKSKKRLFKRILNRSILKSTHNFFYNFFIKLIKKTKLITQHKLLSNYFINTFKIYNILLKFKLFIKILLTKFKLNLRYPMIRTYTFDISYSLYYKHNLKIDSNLYTKIFSQFIKYTACQFFIYIFNYKIIKTKLIKKKIKYKNYKYNKQNKNINLYNKNIYNYNYSYTYKCIIQTKYKNKYINKNINLKKNIYKNKYINLKKNIYKNKYINLKNKKTYKIKNINKYIPKSFKTKIKSNKYTTQKKKKNKYNLKNKNVKKQKKFLSKTTKISTDTRELLKLKSKELNKQDPKINFNNVNQTKFNDGKKKRKNNKSKKFKSSGLFKKILKSLEN